MARQHNRRRLVSNELLEHSARLFATQGYANTSFQDIADSMGISRPALYHYVSNKEEILAALVRDVLERVVEILEQVRDRADLTEDARVEEALRQIVVNNARNTTRVPPARPQRTGPARGDRRDAPPRPAPGPGAAHAA